MIVIIISIVYVHLISVNEQSVRRSSQVEPVVKFYGNAQLIFIAMPCPFHIGLTSTNKLEYEIAPLLRK